MKTSIKIKKFWYADIAADGGCGTNWMELQTGQREGTAQFNGSDAAVTNYKNVQGSNLESQTIKGDKTVNFQFADMTADIIADLIGGAVTTDSEAITITAPENENNAIEKSFRILTAKNVLITLPRCSIDSYPMVNDDDLHYYQVNSTVLKPEKAGTPIFTQQILLTPDVAVITSFVLAAQTGAATINAGAKTVAITVANGTVVTALTPTIGVSLGASITPNSGTAKDFTSPVVYAVENANGTSVNWTVTVTVAGA